MFSVCRIIVTAIVFGLCVREVFSAQIFYFYKCLLEAENSKFAHQPV